MNEQTILNKFILCNKSFDENFIFITNHKSKTKLTINSNYICHQIHSKTNKFTFQIIESQVQNEPNTKKLNFLLSIYTLANEFQIDFRTQNHHYSHQT